jgi:DNA-binding FadR family transcriptional regulator
MAAYEAHGRNEEARGQKICPAAATGGCGRDVAFRTKSDWAYAQLRDWIQGGVLDPGQKLDQEWLAAELGISRIPLRHALVKLEADGLVESRPHQGAIVTPLSLEAAEDIYASRLRSMLGAEPEEDDQLTPSEQKGNA